MEAMYETLEKAMTSAMAQMQAAQDQRDKKMHQSQEKLTESPCVAHGHARTWNPSRDATDAVHA